MGELGCVLRGSCSPRCEAPFGTWDWVANSVLYHLHEPWHIPAVILGSLALTWPARRFRSIWMSIIVHAVEGLPMVLVLGVILGLVP